MNALSLTLLSYEVNACKLIARQRHDLRVSRDREQAGDIAIGNRYENGEIGVYAEYAAAKLLDTNSSGLLQDWLDNRAFSEDHKAIRCDLGSNTQIRATKHTSGGLVLQPYDGDDFAYILATVDLSLPLPSVRLVGWAYGHDVKARGQWQVHWPKPAFLLKRADLHVMDAFPLENL